jgi:hypothetical protein
MSLSRDAIILICLVIVLAVGTLALSSGSKSAGPPYQLSGHGPVLGLSGLGAGLVAADVDVRRGVRPTLGTQGLTVLVQPQEFSRDEAAQWRRAIGDGATVLLAASRPNALTRTLGLQYGPGGVTTATDAGARAFPDATFPSTVEPAFAATPDGSEVLVESPGGPAMVVIPLGKGAVWAASSPRWLTNAGIDNTGLPIALPLANAAGGAVTVDEFHHGAGPRGGTFGYLPAGLQLALLESAIIAAAVLLTVARRLGPAVADDEGHQPSTAELARSMGAMYRAGSRVEAATAALGGQLRRRAGGLAGRVEGPLVALESAPDERQAVAAWHTADEATRRVTGAGT